MGNELPQKRIDCSIVFHNITQTNNGSPALCCIYSLATVYYNTLRTSLRFKDFIYVHIWA